MPDADRIVTVSTIKESPEAASRFVRRTLESGVDHMIVFLDAPQPRVRAVLDNSPYVTVVRTGEQYWQGDRPSMVVDRQMVSANIACHALASCEQVRWLFHIDADEGLAFDRTRLLAIDGPCVRFKTLEAVARRRWRGGEPTLFKRIPSEAELHTLTALGHIAEPDVDRVFRGHSLGKSGVRPQDGVRFRVHTAYQAPDHELDTVIPSDMHLLHYETPSYDDFLARWRGYRPATAARRPFKDKRLGAAFFHVADNPLLTAAERDRLLRKLFDDNVADDVRPLRRFGLLTRKPRYENQRRPLSDEVKDTLAHELTRLGAEDKAQFRSTMLVGAKRAQRTAP